MLAAVAAAVLVDVLSGVLVNRIAHGRYKWLLAPLRQACRRPTTAVLLLAGLYAALPGGPGRWLREGRTPSCCC